MNYDQVVEGKQNGTYSTALVSPSILKFKEDRYLREVMDYIYKTYGAHYSATNGIQAMDAIFASGNGLGFCVGNVQKYSFRYGRKDGFKRDDLMKIVHYAILALYNHDLEHGGDVKQEGNGD